MRNLTIFEAPTTPDFEKCIESCKLSWGTKLLGTNSYSAGPEKTFQVLGFWHSFNLEIPKLMLAIQFLGSGSILFSQFPSVAKQAGHNKPAH